MAHERIPPPGDVPVFEDERGRLTLVELPELPFSAQRAYVLSAIPEGGRRGGHASRSQSRVLVCISGHARVTVDDGHQSTVVELAPGQMQPVPARVWHQIEALDGDLTILVLAEGGYDRADYAKRAELPLANRTPSQTSES